jgi:hypothetical protein
VKAMDIEFVVHEVTYKPLRRLSKILATCSCGAVWSHALDATDELKLSIFRSHLDFIRRTAMRQD